MPSKCLAQNGKDVAVESSDFPALSDRDLATAGDDPFERGQSDKGVAAHLLATFDRFEEKTFAFRPGGSQKCRNGRFQVRCENAADGDEGVLPGKCQELLAAGLDGMNGWLHKLKCNWSEEACGRPSRAIGSVILANNLPIRAEIEPQTGRANQPGTGCKRWFRCT